MTMSSAATCWFLVVSAGQGLRSGSLKPAWLFRPLTDPSALLAGVRIQKISGARTQGFGELFNHSDGGVAAAALNVTHIGPVNIGIEGELFLGKTLGLSEVSDVEPEPHADIHPESWPGCRHSVYIL